MGLIRKRLSLPGSLAADVREDEVAPTVQRDQPTAGGEIAAQLPFLCDARRELGR
jgi:hypothetical protein